MTRYPLSDLADACGLSEHALCVRLGLSGTTMQEARRKGLSELTADRYAVKMGLAAATVWPALIADAILAVSIACPECLDLFIPLRQSHRYCTRKCYQRVYKRERARRLYATDPEFREAQIAKTRAYREANRRAVKIQKATYYQRTKAHQIARKNERRQRARAEGRVAA